MGTFELGLKSGWKFSKGEGPRCGPSLQVVMALNGFGPMPRALIDILVLYEDRKRMSFLLPFWDPVISPLTRVLTGLALASVAHSNSGVRVF